MSFGGRQSFGGGRQNSRGGPTSRRKKKPTYSFPIFFKIGIKLILLFVKASYSVISLAKFLNLLLF